MFYDINDKHSLTAKVYNYVRDNILDGTYKQGDFLVETRLAEELSVSRTPIREALKQLEMEGLLTAMPNRGVMVQGISPNDIDDIYSMRQLLEGLAACWAAERISKEELGKLEETVELMAFYTARNDVNQLSRLDGEFHELIYKACNSRMLRQTLGMLHQNALQARQSSLNMPARPSSSLEEHRAVYAAIEAHDPEAAKAAMELHVKNAHMASV